MRGSGQQEETQRKNVGGNIRRDRGTRKKSNEHTHDIRRDTRRRSGKDKCGTLCDKWVTSVRRERERESLEEGEGDVGEQSKNTLRWTQGRKSRNGSAHNPRLTWTDTHKSGAVCGVGAGVDWQPMNT